MPTIHRSGNVLFALASCALCWTGLAGPVLASPSAGFVRNQGQVADAARYYGSAAGVTVFFTNEGVVLDLREAVAPRRIGRMEIDAPTSSLRNGCAVFVGFDGGSAATMEARTPLAGHTNFYLGNDPDSWQTGVPSFGEIVYRDVWPGIDLVYRVTDGCLTYEVVAASGADPGRIAFRYEGADRVVENGAICRIETPVGTLEDVRPTAGHMQGLLRPAGTGAGGADASGAAPWCTFLGWSAADWAGGVALDDLDRPIVGGSTSSPEYPTTPGAYQDSLAGNQDVFLAKLTADGSALVWSTLLGGTTQQAFGNIALDAQSNPVVVGVTNSVDFPTTPGSWNPFKVGSADSLDAFVAKLDATGGSLLWGGYLGGGKGERNPTKCRVDAAGNVLVCGITFANNFPTTAGAFQETKLSPFDESGYITKISADGSSIVWSTFVGGNYRDLLFDIQLDAMGNVVATGGTQSGAFPSTAGSYDPVYDGLGWAAFVLELDATGSTMLWGTFLESAVGADLGNNVAFDAAGNVIAVGVTNGETFPTTPGAYDETWNGDFDLFVSKLDPTGSTLLWSTFLGGSGDDGFYGKPELAIDADQNIVIPMTTSSPDLPFLGSYAGLWDPAVAWLSEGGDALTAGIYWGGSGDCEVFGMKVSSDSLTAVAVGYTSSTDFPTTPGAYQETHGGGTWDAFAFALMRPDPTSAPVPAVTTEENLLLPCSPNPFRGTTRVAFSLPAPGPARVAVYDAGGRLVRVLDSSPHLTAGSHVRTWDGRDGAGFEAASGVYFLRLEAGQRISTRSVTLLR